MSSTNKTTNLQLSQFLGTDKPAWLGDYNADMQKIDDAFAALSTGAASSTADITALQQKDNQIDQDIKDTNDRIDSMATGDILLANRVTTLEGNYDTMHHEVADNQSNIATLNNKVEYRNTKKVGFDIYDDDFIIDLFNSNNEIHRFWTFEDTAGFVTFAADKLINADTNPTRTVSSAIHFNTNHQIIFDRVDDETVAMYFKKSDNDQIEISFSKYGIRMAHNLNGNVTEIFNIPSPTAPTA